MRIGLLVISLFLIITSQAYAGDRFRANRVVVVNKFHKDYYFWQHLLGGNGDYKSFTIRALDSWEGNNCSVHEAEGTEGYSHILDGTFERRRGTVTGSVTYSWPGISPREPGGSASVDATLDDFDGYNCQVTYPFSGESKSSFDNLEGNTTQQADMSEVYTILETEGDGDCLELEVVVFDQFSDDQDKIASYVFPKGEVHVGDRFKVNGNLGPLKKIQRQSKSGMIGWTTKLNVADSCETEK